MDIHQILVTHNREWTFRETICFAIIFLLAVVIFSLLLYWRKIGLSQMVADLLLPFVMKKKVRWYQAVLAGVIISAGIEVAQLLLCRERLNGMISFTIHWGA